MPTGKLLFITLTLLTYISSASANDSLQNARVALSQIRYEEANTLLIQALQTGTNDKVALVEIYLLAGKTAAALGHKADAIGHFKRLLSLDPNVQLLGESPKITKPFKAAQAFLKGQEELSIHKEHRSKRRLVVKVNTDPMNLVAMARLVVLGEEPVEQAKAGDSEMVFEVAGSGVTKVILSVLDQYGNQLAVFGSESVPLMIGKPVPTQTTQTNSGTPIYAHWAVWLGLGIISAGGTTYFGLQANAAKQEFATINANSANYTRQEAQLAADQWNDNVLYTNIGLGATIGLGSIAALLLLLSTTEGESQAGPLSITPTSEGVNISYAIGF